MRTPSLNRTRRGSVIVVVLVTLMLAALMLVRFMEDSAVELTLATRQADRDRLRADAYYSLETALAVMAEIKVLDGDLHAPEQGWGDPHGYAGDAPREGVTVEFEFVDESGKASLPGLGFTQLVALAEALGLTETDARSFADGLLVWTTEEHIPQDPDAEASNYERADPPHKPPGRGLRSWDELRAVRVARDFVYDEEGALTAFGAALREAVSLYAFEGSNVNAMHPALAVARGWDLAQLATVEAYKAGRTGRPPGAPPWFRGVGDLGPLIGANADTEGLGATVKLLRVRVRVAEGAARVMLDALVAMDDAVALPAAAGTEPPAAAPAEAAARESLNYPFRVLEIIETSGPDSDVTPSEEDPTNEF
jgi:general secretion pathway protein K